MKRRICWPKFDKVCLQGGCGYCDDHPFRTEATILRVLTTQEQRDALEYSKGGGRWRA